jgi:hypothetical protein
LPKPTSSRHENGTSAQGLYTGHAGGKSELLAVGVGVQVVGGAVFQLLVVGGGPRVEVTVVGRLEVDVGSGWQSTSSRHSGRVAAALS